MPSALLLDYNLGEQTGVMLLDWLRDWSRPAPLRELLAIMLTGHDDDRVIEHCFAAGSQFFVTKPCQFSQLCDLVRLLDLAFSHQPPSFELLAHLPNARANPSPTTP